MLESLYAMSRPDTDRDAVTLSEAIALCHRLNEYIVQTSGIVLFAHKILDEAKVANRLPEADSAEALELLADVADLRELLQSQVELMDYRRRKEAAAAH